MKLTFLFMLTGLIAVSASTYSQNTRLDVEVKNNSIIDLFREIEANSEFYFFYQKEELADLENISVSKKSAKVTEILDEALSGTELEYKVVDRYIIVRKDGKGLEDVESITSQQGSVSGTVTDDAGEALPGVTVVIKGTTKGTVTNMDGKYSIPNVPAKATLQFSFMGMLSQEVVVGDQTSISISMKADAIGLEEVVAIGYGTQKKVNLTGSVASVNVAEMAESRPITNVASALAGVAPGVIVNSSNNRPSANGSSSIMIRGQGTLNNSGPLVIIDGVEGSLNSVNPQDIETVSVLKDAASASIYGSRAANGVILITTKMGKAGKVVLDYNGGVAIQSFNRSMNSVSNYADYMEIINEGYMNSGQGALFSQGKIDEWRNDAGRNPLKYPNTDWQDELFGDNGLMNQHNLSVSSGNEHTTLFMSYNYLDNEGIMPNSGYTKHSMRINADTKVTSWLKLGAQLSGYNADTEKGGTGFHWAGASTPGMVHEYDGRYGTINNPEDNPQINNVRRGQESFGENQKNSLKNRFFGVLTPLSGLTIQSSYVYDYYDGYSSSFPKKFIPTWDFYTDTQVSTGEGRTRIDNSNSNTYRHFMDGFARYESSLLDNKLNYSVLAGASQEQFRSNSFAARRYDLLDVGLQVINATNGHSEAGGWETEWAMRSYFGRINLDWEGRYLLEMNLRADGSSRFAEDSRWGYFPSTSFGWRVSEEDFLQDEDWLTNLKLRASYGELGNNSIGNYEWIPVYSASNYVLENKLQPGVRLGSISNSALTWESTAILDIGLDFGLFDNRLTGTIDYFDKLTNNILINLPAPGVHGRAKIPKQNAGEVRNNGVEFELSYAGTIGEEFNFNIGGNVTYINNELTKFKGDVAAISGPTHNLEGRSIGEYYILEFDRIVQTDADVAFVDQIIANAPSDEDGNKLNPFQSFGTPVKGDILYKDSNGDGLINVDDRTMTGKNSLPNWIMGMQVGANWKGFDFNALLQGSFGAYTMYQDTRIGYSSSVRHGYQLNKDVTDGRYFDGMSGTATFPRVLEETAANKNNNINSTFWLYERSYLRIKNIQLGYTVPESVLAKLGISSLSKVRIYTSLEDYFTFTNWPGLDPEVPEVDYPVYKQAMFGLNITF